MSSEQWRTLGVVVLLAVASVILVVGFGESMARLALVMGLVASGIQLWEWMTSERRDPQSGNRALRIVGTAVVVLSAVVALAATEGDTEQASMNGDSEEREENGLSTTTTNATDHKGGGRRSDPTTTTSITTSSTSSSTTTAVPLDDRSAPPMTATDWGDQARAEFIPLCAEGMYGALFDVTGGDAEGDCACTYDHLAASGLSFEEFKRGLEGDSSAGRSEFVDALMSCTQSES